MAGFTLGGDTREVEVNESDNFHPDFFESKPHSYTIKRLSPTIGAELLGIDLTEEISKELKEDIYQALLVYKVIFFRDQKIDTQQHMNFARLLTKDEVKKGSFSLDLLFVKHAFNNHPPVTRACAAEML